MMSGQFVGVDEPKGPEGAISRIAQIQVRMKAAETELQKWTGKVNLGYGQRIEAMNTFCSPLENSAIPILFAVPTSVMKANGSTDEQVEAETALLRQQASKTAK